MATKYLITQNVLKEYDEYVVFQRASWPTSVITPLREWIAWKLIWEQKKIEQKPKTNKIKFLEFVYLSEQEYAELILGYWTDKVKEVIARMNNYLWSKGDPYKSHYHTILVWFAKNWVKKAEVKKVEAKQSKPFVPPTEEQKQKIKQQLQDFIHKTTNNGSV